METLLQPKRVSQVLAPSTINKLLELDQQLEFNNNLLIYNLEFNHQTLTVVSRKESIKAKQIQNNSDKEEKHNKQSYRG